jgi:hypothetical protein
LEKKKRVAPFYEERKAFILRKENKSMARSISPSMAVRFFVILSVATLSVQVTGAQATPAEGWTKTYGIEVSTELAYSVIQTSDGGYVMAGQTPSPYPGGAWLVRVDSNGNAQWNKTYSGKGARIAYSVIQTSDLEGYAIVGKAISSGSGWDAYFVRIYPDGGQWVTDHSYDGGTDYDEARSVIQTSDEGFAIVGSKSPPNRIWLIKTDFAGFAQWNKTYPSGAGSSPDLVYNGYSVVQISDGGYVIAGELYTPDSGSGILLIKTDSDGNQLWLRRYGSTSEDIQGYGGYVIQTNDGGYAIAGSAHSAILGHGIDFWLIKTDANGTKQWYQTYHCSYEEWACSVVQTNDGGYAIAGTIGTRQYNDQTDGVWLIKTDLNGNAQWNKTYLNTGPDHASSLVQTNDGGYAIAGWTRESANQSVSAGMDFWLIKTDYLGMIPEYPSFVIPLVLITITMATTALTKKRLRAH